MSMHRWSWLQDPAVTLIGLVASVIAIVQWVASLCRYIHQLQTEAEEEKYRRVRISIALVALVVVVAFPTMGWPVLTAEAAKAGDHGIMGVLDVLEFGFLGIFAALRLLDEARARKRFSTFECALLVITVITVAIAYSFGSGPNAWIGAAATSSSTNLAIVTLAFLFFAHTRKIGRRQTNVQ
jgi:O-antigen/teichoic acid export membrane protein